ncbi:hypothetical protein KUCAC02_036512 [Chaenocephalus aceratus]|nr:hypothetical protein KUCAC02_036512 [Chaenocephalus aceratus]
MRGAAMSLTAAASGLVVFLFSVSAVQGQDGWGVTFSATEICAVKGSTVEISCTYTHPSTWSTAERTFWFTERKGGEPADLKTASEYAGRVEDRCETNTCTLRIRNLRESDSAEYRFRIETNHPPGNYSGSPGVTLSVTGLTVQVERKDKLKCQSSCLLPAHHYVWYKNLKAQSGASSTHSFLFGPLLVLSSIRSSDSGQYFCRADNVLGAKTSTRIPIDVKWSWILEDIIRTTLGVLMLIPVFLLSLWMRKKKALRSTTEAPAPEEIEMDSISDYENDSHTAAQTGDSEEQGDVA